MPEPGADPGGARGGGSAPTLLELRRVASPARAVGLLAVALWLAARDGRPSGAALAARLLEPDPTALEAQARAGALSIGLGLAALAWASGLARAHARAAGPERALWTGLAAGATRRAAARWIGRVAGAALLALPIVAAAEVAADGAAARPLRATLVHPGAALVDERRAVELELPALGPGRLRIELAVVPGAGPSSRAALALTRPSDGARTTLATPLTGRRGFELELPPGAGPVRLTLERPADAAPWWLASNSLRWIGPPVGGWRASAAAWLEFVAATALAAALWPHLRRRLDGPIAAAALATLWLWAWLGGVHADLLAGGAFPALLDEIGQGLVPARAWLRLAPALGLSLALLALEGRVVDRHGEELRA